MDSANKEDKDLDRDNQSESEVSVDYSTDYIDNRYCLDREFY